MADRRVITLTTDFGLEGPYAASMRGAILCANPDAQIVDISHGIRPGNIQEAAFVLACAYRWFPEFTIHVAVVDPGVGSARRPVLVSTEHHYFLAPDNGILSLVLAQEEIYGMFELNEDHFFLKPTSSTFHGRDIFAPVAGWLAKGMEPSRFGTPIEGITTLPMPSPNEVRPTAWKGAILHVDRFGNLITNLTPAQIPLDEEGRPRMVKLLTGRAEVTQTRRYYTEGEGKEPFLILGGLGYYEIAVNGASAAETLGMGIGSEIGVLARP